MTFKEWMLDMAWHMCFMIGAFVVFCLACSVMEWMAQSWPGLLVLVIVVGWVIVTLESRVKK